MADDCENDEETGHGSSWSVIPSARSSQTVRRQEKPPDIDDQKENLLWKSTIDDFNGEYNLSASQLPVGVCSKVVTRGSSKLYGDHGRQLPHPSKLKKRKQKLPKSIRTPRHNQYGFDVTAHVAQLKRKHAEFNWLPTYPINENTSPSFTIDEDPFPMSSGPQCVPGSPTLANDLNESHSEHSEWPWQLPTLHNNENRVVDLFMDCHQPPQMSASRPFSIPSYAVATRRRSQESLQDEDPINLHSTGGLSAFSSSTSGSEQLTLSPWFNAQTSSGYPDYPFFPISKPCNDVSNKYS